ncbi:transcriptional repressor TCF25-domain-containing protein [Pisolithus marmoratus]|nr:transcriptional repressor TCF25-domain-containing protein [Pisolithus marmoratus]
MAPRLSKRQQREQEELLALTSSRPELARSTSHVSTDDQPAIVAPAKSGFATLFTPDDEAETSVEDSEDNVSKSRKSRKAKKKRKKATNSTAPTDHQFPDKSGASSSRPVVESKLATAKKNKGKKKADIDDVDKALAELSLRYPDLKHISNSSSDERTNALASLLSVSQPHLDAESELRKFFGSRAVTAAESSESGPSQSHKRRRGMPSTTLRSQLTRPDRSWSLVKPREGLSLRPLTEAETAGKARGGPACSGKWWTVEYTRRYKGATRDFIRAVRSGAPDAMWEVLHTLPWHADTLLQLGELYRHREGKCVTVLRLVIHRLPFCSSEYSTAVDHVSRAIFTYERAFVGTFSFTSGVNRLDFDFVENRPFFLAIHQQVIDLQRRGCPRSAFEHARLLFSLEPLTDPHGALLHLDFLAIKAGMGDWLLDVWKVYRSRHDAIEAGGEYMDPSVLPGWMFARALLLRMEEKIKRDRSEDVTEESTEALKQAISAYPSVVPLLADKCEISLSANIRSHKEFRICTDSVGLSPAESVLHLLSHIYAIRSASLWKLPDLSSWLVSTASTLLPNFSSNRAHPFRERFLRVFNSDHLRHSVYRHIIVLQQTHAQEQYRILMTFIPRGVLTSHEYACDPLPPPTARSSYDTKFFEGAEDLTSQRGPYRRTRAEERQLERLVPDAAIREQLIALFERLPGLAAQLPGGMVQFVQAVAQMGDEAVEDLLMAGLRAQEEPGPEVEPHHPGAMPGGIPEYDDELDDIPPMDVAHELVAVDQVADVDNRADGADGAEAAAPLPLRVVRNILSMLWGGTGEAPEGSSDDAESVVRDEDGVD